MALITNKPSYYTHTYTHIFIYYIFSTDSLFNLRKKRTIFVIIMKCIITISIFILYLLIDACIKCMQSNLICNRDVLHKSEHRIRVDLLNNFHSIRFSHFKNLCQLALFLVCNYLKHTFFNENLQHVSLFSMTDSPIEEHRFPSNI